MPENKPDVPKKDERVYYKKTHETAGRVAGGLGAIAIGKPVLKYFHDLAAAKAGGLGPKGIMKRPFVGRGAGITALIAAAAPFAVAGSAVGANIQREGRENRERRQILKSMVREGKAKLTEKQKKASINSEGLLMDQTYLFFVKEAVDLVAPQEFKAGRAWSVLGRGIDAPCQYNEGVTFRPHTKTAGALKWLKDVAGVELRAAEKTLAAAKKSKVDTYARTAQSQKAHEKVVQEAGKKGPNLWERHIPSIFKQKTKKERVTAAVAKMKKSKSFKATQTARIEAKDLARLSASDYRAAQEATSTARRQAGVGAGALGVTGGAAYLVKRKLRKKRENKAQQYV